MKRKGPPIGFVISQTAKAVTRAFNTHLAETGGSMPVWLVLLDLSANSPRLQAELAEIVGVSGPTLTHHLNAMESGGLIVRQRMQEDRRAHSVAITEKGRALFQQLRRTAQSYDRQLRAALSVSEMAAFRQLLQKITDAARSGG